MLTNPRSDRVRSVHGLVKRPVRERTGRFLVEGPQGVREAIRYAADRVEHIAKDLLPRLEAGQTVLCDRYYFSNFAYQTLTSDLEDLLRYNAFARRTLRPDAVVFVDVDPEECARRRAHRGGAAEFYEKTELARQIRTGYQQVFDRLKTEEHILIVDGSGGPDQVEARIWSALQGYFESGVDEEIAQP